ncbi:MAG: DUF1501 domain-containing protein [Gemmatimonadaceae bacterium]|nr:DUF1501 domain-containing protein [Chitinophagaceae bacterium]
MKRRDFLRNTIPATILPVIVGGLSVKAYGAESPLVQALMGTTTDTDKVLVLIQLNGGNDGLNMVIPIDIYGNYYNARQNIAIPQNRVLTLNGNDKTGLHPSMTGLQTLYNEGKLAVIQAVGYPSPNFSHFRATDIWMSASDSNKVVNTGWAGRYLGVEYPNFPNGYPNAAVPDPLAIQIGSITSLALQGPSVNMGMSITDPTNFYNLIDGVIDPAPDTPWGKELKYIRLVAQQTQQYAQVIKNAAAAVPTQGAYPSGNDLAAQLKVVARLIKGGLKTRVYMVSTGGFDTHSAQTDTADTTIGNHANLLARVSNAIKAFMDDVKALGVEDRVIGMTFSEFGRRIKSNSSVGTDHGAAAPVFVFGKNVRSGVYGNNPAIAGTVSVNDNIPFQYDFRSIYASILSQWFCVKTTDLETIMFKNFQNIPLCVNGACSTTGLDDVYRNAGDQLIVNYPNPFVESTKITFKTSGGHTLVHIIDTLGRSIKTLADKEYAPGVYNVDFNSYGLPPGVYYARFQNGAIQQVRSMLKVR